MRWSQGGWNASSVFTNNNNNIPWLVVLQDEYGTLLDEMKMEMRRRYDGSWMGNLDADCMSASWILDSHQRLCIINYIYCVTGVED